MRSLAFIACLVATLWAAPAASAAGEYEPNDSISQTAGPLMAETEYIATYDTSNDVDWYRFYTGGQVQMHIRGIVLGDNGDNCEMSLRNRDGEDLNYTEIYEGEFQQIDETLYRPGLYHVVVDCTDFLGADPGARYSFTISPAGATVGEACGISLGGRADAINDLTKAQEKVAKLKRRKMQANGKRARQRIKAKLRNARGVAANAQAEVNTWEFAVAVNC